jgi:hypothetical protein
MRIVTKSELQTTKPLNNTVILKNVFKSDEIPTKSGVKLYMNTVRVDAVNQNWIVNEVISVPKKLIYGEKTVHVQINISEDKKETQTARQCVGMPWKTNMEVLPHDIVWVNRLTMKNCDDRGDYLLCEDTKYYIFPYSDIYLKHTNNGGIKMLNYWCLVEPYIENETQLKLQSIGLEYAEAKKQIWDKGTDKLGILRYHGGITTEYYDGRDVGEDDPTIAEGDIVCLKRKDNRRIGNDTNVLQGKEYICCRIRDFAAVIRDSIF